MSGNDCSCPFAPRLLAGGLRRQHGCNMLRLAAPRSRHLRRMRSVRDRRPPRQEARPFASCSPEKCSARVITDSESSLVDAGVAARRYPHHGNTAKAEIDKRKLSWWCSASLCRCRRSRRWSSGDSGWRSRRYKYRSTARPGGNKCLRQVAESEGQPVAARYVSSLAAEQGTAPCWKQ